MAERVAYQAAFTPFSETIADRLTVQHLGDLPAIERPDLFFTQLANFRELSITHVSIKPGRNHPPHLHAESHHAIYFIEGEGTMTVGEKTHAVSPGAFILIPQNVMHHATNTGAGPLNYIQMLVPVR